MRLDGREIVLVVGGGISGYKSAAIAREILRRGGQLETVLTASAARFVGAVTFAGITGRAPRTDLWDPSFPGELHIALSARAHAIVVAPATANLMARAAGGLADDLATAVLLSASAPILMAPAMHTRMWEHPATQANVQALADRGVRFVGPVSGPLASGEDGMGRMAEPEAIVDALCATFVRDLVGRKILVTAGPTHEAIDPVRYVANRSSGKMGVAIAEAARDRGATVTLVHGPMTARVPAGVNAVAVRSAVQMHEAVMSASGEHDAVVMAAAVADYRPSEVALDKIKKDSDELFVRMVKNPDILRDLGARRGNARKPALVGFAVESRDLLVYAKDKLASKKCDLIVANLAEHGFEGDDNTVTLVRESGSTELGRMNKRATADKILDALLPLMP